MEVAGLPVGIVAALVAAILYSLGGVMQHRGISRQAANAFDAAGVGRGIRQPIWIGGLAIQAVAVAVQLAALGFAPLVVVQTIMTTMVFWMLLFAAAIEHARLGRPEYTGSVVVALGVVGFVIAWSPTGAEGAVHPGRWAVATAVALALWALSVVAARRISPGPAAAVLGASAGVLNVLGAGLASAALVVMGASGWQAMLTTWLPYGAAAVIVASIGATAMAFAAGPVTASIPPMIAANPVVGAVLGVLLLGEAWPGDAASALVAAIALAVMIAGLVLLSRSRVLAEQLT